MSQATQRSRKILLRSCPRCRGDLFPDEEELACLQCGRRVDASQLVAQLKALALAA